MPDRDRAAGDGLAYEELLRRGGEGILRDLADVQDLIVRLRLPLSFGDSLDASIQGAYQDLWTKAQEGTA